MAEDDDNNKEGKREIEERERGSKSLYPRAAALVSLVPFSSIPPQKDKELGEETIQRVSKGDIKEERA